MRRAWLVFLAGCGFHAAPPSLLETDQPVDSTASFDAASCPASYRAVLPGLTATSRYRLIAATGHADVLSDQCNADMPGATHLIVLDDLPEVLAVSALIESTMIAPPVTRVWVGAVQLHTARPHVRPIVSQPRDTRRP